MNRYNYIDIHGLAEKKALIPTTIATDSQAHNLKESSLITFPI